MRKSAFLAVAIFLTLFTVFFAGFYSDSTTHVTTVDSENVVNTRSPYTIAATATIWTDKADYMPGEIVTVFGSDFDPDVTITIDIVRPDDSVDTGTSISNSSGEFVYYYDLNGIEGLYDVVATDGTNTASTTFTDCRDADLAIQKTGPNVAIVGETITYEFRVDNLGPGRGYDVIVNDNLLGPITLVGLTDEDGDGNDDDLAVGAFATGTADFLVPLFGNDPIVNTALVSARTTDLHTANNQDGHTVDVLRTGVVISKIGSALAHVGDAIDYTITVQNTGETDLYITSLTDTLLLDLLSYPISGDVDSDGVLDFGETWTIDVSRTVLETDPDPLLNSVTIVATNSFGEDEVSDSADWTTDILHPSFIVNKIANPTVAHTGDTITYTITVENNGDCPLWLISITDDLCPLVTFVSGDTNANNILDVGEIWEYTCNGPALADDFTNSIIVIFEDELHLPVPVSDSAFVEVLNPDIVVVKTGPDYAHIDDEITYTYTVTNPGDCPLMVTVEDDIAGAAAYVSGDDDLDGWLDTDETWIFQATYTVPDSDDITNICTATGTDALGGPDGTVTSSDTHTVDVLNPAIEVIKSGPDYGHEGEDLTYYFVVRNLGDCPLYGVVIIDDKIGDLTSYLPDDTLDVGEENDFYTTLFVTPDFDPLVNVVDVQGSDILGLTVTDGDSHTLDVLHPGISVTKSGPSEAHEGDLITYTITVINTGDCPLYSVNVADPTLGFSWTGDLALGESQTFMVDFTILIPSDDVTNVVTASGLDILDFPVFDDATWTVDVLHPAIEVTKTAGLTLTFEDLDDRQYLGEHYVGLTFSAGTWCYQKPFYNWEPYPPRSGTNVIGNEDFGLIRIDFDFTVSMVGAWFVTDGVTVILEAYDMSNNLLDTTSVSSGFYNIEYAEVRASGIKYVIFHDAANYWGLDDLTYVPESAPWLVAHEGDMITYTYEVTNTGDCPLQNIVVTDDLGFSATYITGDDDFDGWLDTNEEWTFEAFHLVPTPSGDIANIGTAYGTDNLVETVEDSDSHYLDVLHPAIDVTKSTTPETYLAHEGDEITYTYVVTNIGDCDLYDVLLLDDVFGPISLTGLADLDSDGFADDLASGEFATGTHTYIVDPLSPEYSDHLINFATAAAHDFLGLAVEDTDSWEIDILHPEIVVSKIADPTVVHQGDTITYTIIVENIGDCPLSQFAVIDDHQTSGITYVSGDANFNSILDIAEAWVYSCSLDAEADDFTNIAEATFTDALGLDVSSSASAVVEVLNPSIEVWKTAATTITFEGLGHYQDVGAYYPGITFTGATCLVKPDYNWIEYPPHSGTTVVFDITGGTGVIRIDFDFTVSLVGAWFTTYMGVYIEAYDMWDNLLDATSVSPNVGTIDYAEVVASGIKYVLIHDTGNTFTMDDLTYVPETQPWLVVHPGDMITYTIFVENTGDCELIEVSVTDDHETSGIMYVSGDDGNGFLDIGEIWIYSCTGPADADDFINTALATFRDELGLEVSDSGTADVEVLNPSIEVWKTAGTTITFEGLSHYQDVGSYYPGLTFTGASCLVKPNYNWQDYPPHSGDVVVFDVTGGTGVIRIDFDFTVSLVGAWYTTYMGVYIEAYDVWGNLVDSTTVSPNTGTSDYAEVTGSGIKYVLIHDTGNTFTMDDLTYIIDKVHPGDLITYTIFVQNVGDCVVDEDSVTDDFMTTAAIMVGGDINSNDLLDIGETWIYTGSGPAPSDDFTNTAEAIFVDELGLAVSDIGTVDIEVLNPSILVSKFADPVVAHPSDIITYTIFVENNGDCALWFISINDDHETSGISYSSGDDGNGILDVGEIWEYTCSGPADADDFTNTADATFEDELGLDVSDSGTAFVEVLNPSIEVSKTAGTTITFEDLNHWQEVLDHYPGLTFSPGTICLVKPNYNWPGYPPHSGNNVLDSYATGYTRIDFDFTVSMVGAWFSTDSTTVHLYAYDEFDNLLDSTSVFSGYSIMKYAELRASGIKYVVFEDTRDYWVMDDLTYVPEAQPWLVVHPGDIITYSIFVENTGDCELTQVSVTDDHETSGILFVSGDDNFNGLLDIGEIWVYSCTGPAEADDFTNTAAATFEDELGLDVSDTGTAFVEVLNPSIVLDKTASPTIVHEGDTITYTITVYNDGDCELWLVSVIDDKCGSATYVSGDDGNGVLDIGETWTYTCEYLAEADDFVNTAVATFSDELYLEVSASDTAFVEVLNPSIEVTKVAHSILTFEDLVHEQYLEDHYVGLTFSTGTWCYEKPYYNWEPYPPHSGTNVIGNPVTGSIRIDFDFTVSMVGAWFVTDGTTVILEAYDAANNLLVSSSVSSGFYNIEYAELQASGIKYVVFYDAANYWGIDDLTYVPETATWLVVHPGDMITYSIFVENTGDCELTEVSVTDDHETSGITFVGGDDGNGLLDIGEIWIYSCTGPADADDFVNTAYAAFVDELGLEVSDSGTAEVEVLNPSIVVLKSANPTVAHEGDTITYTITVYNDGDCELWVASVIDDKCGSATYVSGDDGNGVLDIDETWTYTCEYLAEADDFVNNAVAAFTDELGLQVSDSDTASVEVLNPSIEVTKTASTTITFEDLNHRQEVLDHYPGLTFSTGTICLVKPNYNWPGYPPHSGNAVLDSIATGYTRIDFDFSVSMVGAWFSTDSTTVYLYAYDEFDNLLDSTSVFSGYGVMKYAELSASGIKYVVFEDTADYWVMDDLIYVPETQPWLVVHPGDMITYTIYVENTGDCELTEVSVTDDHETSGILFVSGDDNFNGLLDIGEIWVYSCTGPAEADDFINTALATFRDELGLEVSDSGTADIEVLNPSIEVWKIAGTTITFEDLAHQQEVLTFYQGLTFTGATCLVAPNYNDYGYPPHSGNGVIYNPSGGTGEIRIDFDFAVSMVGAWFATGPDYAGGTVYLEAYDMWGNLLDTSSASSGYALPMEYAEVQASGIKYVIFHDAADFWVMDDLTYVIDKVHPGDSIIYTIYVENTGDCELTEVSITDDHETSGITFIGGDDGNGLLDIGEIWVYSCTGPAEADDFVNTAYATFEDELGLEVSDFGTADVEVLNPSIVVLKTANPTVVHEGDGITYTITVYNDGDCELWLISITDDKCSSVTYLSGDDGNGILDAGETWTYTCEYLAEADDFVNTAAATFADELGLQVSDSDTASVEVLNPSIEVTKTASTIIMFEDLSHWEEVLDHYTGVTFSAGTYCLVYPNYNYAGYPTHSGTHILDSADTGTTRIDFDFTVSMVGAWFVTGGITVYLDAYDALDNLVDSTTVSTAYGTNEYAELSGSGIKYVIFHNGADHWGLDDLTYVPETAPWLVVHPGDMITYTIYVENTGDCELTQVSLTDDHETSGIMYISGDDGNGFLDIGEIWVFSCTGPAESDDFTNTADATFEDELGLDVSDFGTAFVEVLNPSIEVTKTAYSMITFEDLIHEQYLEDHYVGLTFSTGTWCYQKPYYNWEPYPPHSGTNVIGNPVTGSIRIDFDFTVSMVGAWFVTDGTTVVLEAYDASNNLLDTTTVSSGFYNIEYAEVRASGIKYVVFYDTANYWGLDDLTYVPETAPWLVVHPGDMITYSIFVENTGDCELTEVSITDDHETSGIMYVSGDDGNGVLDVGETWVYSCTGPADADDFVNTAYATFIDELGLEVSDSDTADVEVLNPSIVVLKSANPTVAHEGDTITYTITVYNDGDCELWLKSIIDDKCGSVTYVSGDDGNGLLDVGETWTYTCEYLAEADDFVNTAIATFIDELGLQLSDSDTAYVEVLNPSIEVTKTASTTITFEDLNHWQDVLDHYPGLTFSPGTICLVKPNYYWQGYPPHSGNNVLDSYVTGYTRIDFDFTVSMVGAWFSTDSTTVYLYAYDELDNLLDSTSVFSGYGVMKYAELSASGIKYVVFEDTADYWVMDDLTYVPEVQPWLVVHPGDMITYMIYVENTGDCELTMVSITDDHETSGIMYVSGDDGNGLLDIGEIWVYSCTGPAEADDFTNYAEAVFEDELGLDVSDYDTAFIEVLNPSIEISKTASQAVVITFEELIHNQVVGTYYPGLTFSGASALVKPNYNWELYPPHSGNAVIHDWPTGVIRVDFDFSVSLVGAWFATGPFPRIVFIEAYDEFGNLLAVTSVNPGPGVVEYSEVQASGIRYVLIHDSGNTFILDDLTYVAEKLMVHEGDDVTYTYEVWNTGDCPLQDVYVTDSLGIPVSYVSGDDGDGWLESGEIWIFQATYTVPIPSDDVCNIGTAYGTDLIGLTVDDSDGYCVDVLHPAIDVEKSGPIETHEGDTIEYSIVLRNTGDCPLYDVFVEDVALGFTWTGRLYVGDELTFILPVDVPEPSDDLYNTATTLGMDYLGWYVDDSSIWIIDVLHPAIELDKTASPLVLLTFEDLVHQQEVLTFYPGLTFTGATCLVAPFYNDYGYPPHSGNNVIYNPIGGTGEIRVDFDFTVSMVGAWFATGPDYAGGTVYLEAYDMWGNLLATSSASSGYALPMEYAEVQASGIRYVIFHDAADYWVMDDLTYVPEGQSLWMAHEGDVIIYTYEVTNTGDCPLQDIYVTDSLGFSASYIGGDDGDGWLESSEIWVFQAAYTVPIPSEDIYNIATAFGTDNLLRTVEASDDHDVDILHPSMLLTKVGPEEALEGETFDYEITIRNDGDCILYNVLVEDVLLGFSWTGTLDIGQELSFVVPYTVPNPTEALTNYVTAFGEDIIGGSADALAEHSVIILHTGVFIEKTGPESADVGDTITYTITVYNTGEVDLYISSLDDSLLGDLSGWISDGVVTKAEGSESFEVEYTIVSGDWDPLINVVTVVGVNFYGVNAVSDSASWDVEISYIRISKLKVGLGTAEVGEEIEYSITVYNLGTVNLHITSLTDSLLGDLSDYITDGVITAAEGSETFSVFWIVQDVPDPLLNEVTVYAWNEFSSDSTDSDSCEVDILYTGIRIEKTGPDTAEVGQRIIYTITIYNTGEVDLIIDSLEDSIFGDLSGYISDGVITLYEGFETFTLELVVEASGESLLNIVEVIAYNQYFADQKTVSDDWEVDILYADVEVGRENWS
ncbi:MAG: DUF7507 domain-containing protein [Candidatus Thorarchaeota archaeon]